MTTGFDVTASAGADSLTSALKPLGALTAPLVVALLMAAAQNADLGVP